MYTMLKKTPKQQNSKYIVPPHHRGFVMRSVKGFRETEWTASEDIERCIHAYQNLQIVRFFRTSIMPFIS